ncbi:MAG TPA: gamma-glutamylcyclotransferase family protein [Verrucomicrobiae bacterium]|nr:gamma-glutamylcyclotransferase family protein [Verrucomicrobiae bacterium]
MTDQTKIKCFFYGTIRSGYWNSHRITNTSKLIAPAVTEEKFRLFIQRGNVPCAVPTPDGYPLVGEVWELSDADAQWVQWLERGYQFKTTTVTAGSQRINAGIYFCEQAEDSPYYVSDQREEHSGDFSNAVKPKS